MKSNDILTKRSNCWQKLKKYHWYLNDLNKIICLCVKKYDKIEDQRKDIYIELIELYQMLCIKEQFYG